MEIVTYLFIDVNDMHCLSTRLLTTLETAINKGVIYKGKDVVIDPFLGCILIRVRASQGSSGS